MVRNGLKHQQESNLSIKNDELAGYYWDIHGEFHGIFMNLTIKNDDLMISINRFGGVSLLGAFFTVQLLPPAYGTSVGII